MLDKPYGPIDQATNVRLDLGYLARLGAQAYFTFFVGVAPPFAASDVALSSGSAVFALADLGANPDAPGGV